MPPHQSHPSPGQSPLGPIAMSPGLHHAGLPQPLPHGRDRQLDMSQLPPNAFPPPRPSSQASTESERRPSRTLASFQSILNPTAADDVDRQSRRRSAAQMEDDSGQISPTTALPSHRPLSSSGPLAETSPSGFQGAKQPGVVRRILTPISPTLHRTTSLNRITGTIDAASTPFLSSDSRLQTAEPMSTSLPPYHPMPGPFARGSSFSHSQGPSPPLQHAARRKSVSVLPSAIPSARASPSPSISSFTHSGQASPLPYPVSSGPTPSGSFSLSHSPASGLALPEPLEPDPQGISLLASTSGQTTYEYIQIQSARGPVMVPVETQVASKQADEKRKRNAGASARFRARRKEKEKEASTTIDRLKDQLRMVKEDCEYYRSEKERLMEALKEMPGWERHVRRSPSPPAKRRSRSVQSASTDGLTPGALSPTSPHPSLSQEPPADGERNTRRRLDLDSYSLPSPGLPKPGGMHSPFQPGFGQYPQQQQHQGFGGPAPMQNAGQNHRLPPMDAPSQSPPWPPQGPHSGHQ